MAEIIFRTLVDMGSAPRFVFRSQTSDGSRVSGYLVDVYGVGAFQPWTPPSASGVTLSREVVESIDGHLLTHRPAIRLALRPTVSRRHVRERLSTILESIMLQGRPASTTQMVRDRIAARLETTSARLAIDALLDAAAKRGVRVEA